MALDVNNRRYTLDELQQYYPDWRQIRLSVNLVASTTYLQGSRIGQVTATPGTFGPYNSGASDGTQTAVALMPRTVTTDASGNIFYGTTATSEFGEYEPATPAIFSGVYATQDLAAGFNGTQLGQMGGRLLKGTIAAGVFLF